MKSGKRIILFVKSCSSYPFFTFNLSGKNYCLEFIIDHIA